MKKITLGRGLSLPIDAVTQTFGFIARKGAGKTYAAGKMAEEMLRVGAQVVVIDIVGNWWGLRLAANGKSCKTVGVPQIAVLGGAHGDFAITPDSGAVIAGLIVERGVSAVLDLSEFRKADRLKFATAFAEELFHLQKKDRRPLHLVLEEAQKLAPQRAPKGHERMLGAFEDIVRLGRNYGIGATMVTQRPQSVNKEVLSQVECLLLLQTNGAHERKAIRAWVDAKDLGDEAAFDDFIRELPGLDIGEAFVWSPAWLKRFDRVRIGKKKTWDGSATPVVGQRSRKPQKLRAEDFKGLEEALQDVRAAAEENDPAALKRKLRAAERRVATLEARPAETHTETVEVSVVTKSDRARLGRLEAGVEKLRERLDVLVTEISGRARPAPPAPSSRRPAPSAPSPAEAPCGDVNAPKQAILDAVGFFQLSLGHDSASRVQAALIAGVSHRSSGYEKNLSTMRMAGLLDYPSRGRLKLTARGQALSRPRQGVTPEELYATLKDLLSAPRWRILDQLIERHPDSTSRAELAGIVGVSERSSGFEKNLSTLRTFGLIDYPERGYVRANDVLFF